MKFRKAAKYFIVISLLALVVYIVTGFKSQAPDQENFYEFEADGEGMVHEIFDDESRKIIELKAAQAKKSGEDRTDMKVVRGLILKKNRLNKDVQIYGDEGYTENNYYNFYVEKNARLKSEDFDIKSHNFFLKDRAILTSKEKVIYETKELKGVAKKGMEFHINNNVLRFYNTRGHYKKDNRDFAFKTDSLWVIDKQNQVIMEKHVVIREQKSILRSGWLSMEFSEEFKHIKKASSLRDSYLYMEDRESLESKEIKAGSITSFYDETGKLEFVSVVRNAEVMLKDQDNHTMITADALEMTLNPDSGSISKVVIPVPGQVESTGKAKFRIIADQMKADYDDQAMMEKCHAEGNCDFIIDEYSGYADDLVYNIKTDTILLDGQKTRLATQNNTFDSKTFKVNTKEKTLTSAGDIKSTIQLKEGGVLFKEHPIFVNAKKLSLFEKDNRVIYEQKVSLLQDDIGLSANRLEIANNDDIELSGSVSLSFKSGDKEVRLKGDRCTFNSKEKAIELMDNAGINSDDNVLTSDRLLIRFNDKNELSEIVGEGGIDFTKEDLSGTAGKVTWSFQDDTMTFEQNPQVVKKKGATTYGEVLKINLNNSIITILSRDGSRTETILQ